MKKSNDRVVAVELMGSSICQLDCTYCYIPKCKIMKDIQKEINEWIESGRVIDDLKNTTSNLQVLSLWGAEPTFVLKPLNKIMPKLLEEFPKLNKISYSSNFVGNIDDVIELIETIPNERKFEINAQISYDSIYTNENRGSGRKQRKREIRQIILDNVKKLIDYANDNLKDNITLGLHWKMTIIGENIEELVNNQDKFDSMVSDLKEVQSLFRTKRRNIRLSRSIVPSLEVPGEYTVQDGINFTKFHELLHKNHLQSAYDNRVDEMLKSFGNIDAHIQSSSCSAGDSCVALISKGIVTPCHRFCFDHYPGFTDESLSKSINTAPRCNIEATKEKLSIRDKDDEDRIYYIQRCYHEYPGLKYSMCYGTIKAMALSNQLHERYKSDDTLCKLLSIFVSSKNGCHLDGLSTYGNMYVQNYGLLRIFGNGYFQTALRRCANEQLQIRK